MKKTQSLLICLAFCLTVFGQQQSKIQAPYGNWYRVNLHSGAYVSISYALSKCHTDNGWKDVLVGQSYYRIDVRFAGKGTLRFKFDWWGCDGKKGTEIVRVDMSKKGIDAGDGMFFFGYEASAPYDVSETGTEQAPTQTNPEEKPRLDWQKQSNPGTGMGRRADNGSYTKPETEAITTTDNLQKSQQTTQSKQREQTAEYYRNMAQNHSADAVQQAQYLNMAQNYATASGNKALAQQIQQQKAEIQQQNNQELAKNATELVGTLFKLFEKKEKKSAQRTQTEKDQITSEDEDLEETKSEANEIKREKEEEQRQKREERMLAMEETRNVRIKQREAAEAAAKERQRNQDRSVLGKYMTPGKLYETPEGISQVFFITYDRDYRSDKVRIKTYTVDRFNDGTWPMKNDILNKIAFREYYDDNGTGMLVGFFTRKQDALDITQQIKKTFPCVIDESFLSISPKVGAPAADSTFWNQ